MPATYASRPAADEHAEYYARYIGQVPDGDIVAILERQRDATLAALRDVPEDRAGHRYAPDKWSIREMIGHMIDTERVFAYRMLRIARSDATPLAGFEQNDWVAPAGYDDRSLADIADEYAATRNATLALLRGLPEEAMTRRGTASGYGVTARALAWMTAGHELHHRALLRERYLA